MKHNILAYLLSLFILPLFVSSYQPNGDKYVTTLLPDISWSILNGTVGEIGGLATCQYAKLHVLHRADRHWTIRDFDQFNIYQRIAEGPIKGNVIAVLHPLTGRVLDEWGKGGGRIDAKCEKTEEFCGFHLPHGLTIDSRGYRWITDVALHQVLRFRDSAMYPDLILGEKFVPGSDEEHFCKPTDVAVAEDGSFFIADGYCNNRILHFNSSGTVFRIIEDRQIQLPHSIALSEKLGTLCVASRQNQRIICYCAGIGNQICSDESFYFEFDAPVYAIAFDSDETLLYAVTSDTQELAGKGYVIDIEKGKVISKWGDFEIPHDITINEKYEAIFVGELKPDRISKWKFYESRNG